MISLANGATSLYSEIPVRTMKDNKKILSLFLSAVPGHEHDLSKVLVSFIDITELKQTEKALKEREEKVIWILTHVGLYKSNHELSC